jgi:cytochrome c oxidase subunit 1
LAVVVAQQQNVFGIGAFGPIFRGLIGAAIGAALGVAAVVLVRSASGHNSWHFEQAFVVAYMLALPGWLLGVGLWSRWAKEWLGMETEHDKAGPERYLAFTTDHKVIGIQYLITFLLLFLFAGLLAMAIRAHLLTPEGAVFSEANYNRVMSMHGIIMVAVAVASVIGGLGNYFVPLMIGTDDMAFPRLNALSFWLVPPVAILLLMAQAFGGWDSGWTAYAPLSTTNAHGQVFFNLAIITFGLSSILGGLNFLVTIVFMRAPGMSLMRLPIFVWSIFAASCIALTFTQLFAAAVFMVTLDRIAGTVFFNAEAGGDPLLYQHIFWFYSHPAVYIFVLPGFGITLEILAHFSRKPLFAYKWAVGGLLGIVLVSGAVWAHHMFVAGIATDLLAPFLITTEIISVPTGLIFLSALGTIWMGRLWLKPPMLFALAVIFNFLIGGVTGIHLADVPTDLSLSDTYFVVAHFHYTIIGAEIFALFGAIYYWFPKITGRMYDEGLAVTHFLLMFIGFNVTFLPMFWAGFDGMNRRVASYTGNLADLNAFISAASFILGASFLFFVYNMVHSLYAGEKAEPNPWKARTLEWQTSSPPPVENFPTPPVVVGGAYDYGTPSPRPHAVFSPAGAAEPPVALAPEGGSAS